MPAAAKVCFDRILPRDLMRFQPTRRAGGRSRAISPIGKTWVNGSTLQVKFIGGTAAQKAKVREQAGWWFIEKGFGPLDSPLHPTFPDLAAAEAWLKAELADNPRLRG